MEKILFVCLGNICRSPMAEGAFRYLSEKRKIEVEMDSAGTGGWHAGEAPDPRMQSTALAHGIDISDLRARQFVQQDFDHFDRIFVMDASNFDNVLKLARNPSDTAKVEMMLNLTSPGQNRSVPDPYYGGDAGFEAVYQMLMDASEVLLDQLEK